MAAFVPRGWRLVRLGGGSEPRLGAIDPAAPQVVRELSERDPLAALRRGLAAGAAQAVGEHVADDPAKLTGLPLLAPLAPEEIWAAGVTYERSRSARVEESESAADVYDRVYEADRPEIFLKDAGCRRTVGPNEPVAVRTESTWTVPEAELGLVLGSDGEILAFTAGNDLTARDIEAANPLYIPQAKLFAACCAIGPAVLVPDDPGAPLEISVRIWDTDGALVNEDGTSTAKLHRTLEELAGWCVRENPVPDGTVLLTGTGIVPPDEVALAPGYRVEVEVEGIGILANPVRAASSRSAGRTIARWASPIGVRPLSCGPRPPGAPEPARHARTWACCARPKRSGRTATASISTFMPGTGSSRTPTSVLAGRDSPKKAWRSGLISGRSSTSVR